MDIEREFMEGYFDGRDIDCPDPSSNRSNCYRHSFLIGRMELNGTPIPAKTARVLADIAEANDAKWLN